MAVSPAEVIEESARAAAGELEPVGMAVGRWSPTAFGIGGLLVKQQRGRRRDGIGGGWRRG